MRPFADQLNVRYLADIAGMNATFHRHFKAVTAMTPVQYQKQLRLQEARRLLLADSADVARIGYAKRVYGQPGKRDNPGRDDPVKAAIYHSS